MSGGRRTALLRVVLRAAFVGALLLTASCISPEELRRYDEATCASYGFRPGTSDFAACLQRESLARRYAPTEPWPYWGPPPYWRFR